MNVEGLVAVPTDAGVEAALEKLEAVVRGRGLIVFARVDHAANAREVGLALRSTTLVLFGDARVGTRLMQSAQTIAIDLPHRVLIWTDERGQTWLGYNDPAWLARRHGIPVEPPIVAMGLALANIIKEACVENTQPTTER